MMLFLIVSLHLVALACAAAPPLLSRKASASLGMRLIRTGISTDRFDRVPYL